MNIIDEGKNEPLMQTVPLRRTANITTALHALRRGQGMAGLSYVVTDLCELLEGCPFGMR